MHINNSYYKYFTAIYSCIFYMHYSLVSNNFTITNIPFLFFGTVFSYDYLQKSVINKLFLIIAAAAATVLSLDMLVQYSLISLITLLYPKYLRSNLLLKPIAIAISWCLLFKSNDFYLYLEAFLLIIALSLPFDLRDKIEDYNIKTLAHILNEKTFKFLCMTIWCFFLSLKVYNQNLHTIDLPATALTVYYLTTLHSIKVNSNRFVTYVFLDSTIVVQFALTYLKQ